MTTPSRPGIPRWVGIALAVAIAVVLLLVILDPFGGRATPEPGPAASTLRLQGSNTVGSELAPDLAEAFLRTRGATDVQRVSGDGLVTISGTLPDERAPDVPAPTRIEIRSAGTETAFDGLASGEASVGMASRRITPAEAGELAGRGDLLARESEHVLALDAVAVVVAPGNPVTTLSDEQLRGVFTCAITDWGQVGGTPGPIRVLARDENSGTFETFRDTVLAGQPLCPAAERPADSAELSRAVTADPAAIGFVGLPFVGGNTALELYSGTATPTGPDALSVSTERYLLTRRLYLYLPTLPADDPLARDFVESFSLSESAQRIVEENGFVSPLFPPPAPEPPPCVDAPAEYCAAVAGAERVPFDVRFNPGTDQLDNRAFRNLDLFAETAGPGRSVLLVGFADNAGEPAANLVLSQNRAVSVQNYLGSRGAQATVLPLGFGEALPVDTNDTPEGREQNRRVEVWLR